MKIKLLMILFYEKLTAGPGSPGEPGCPCGPIGPLLDEPGSP